MTVALALAFCSASAFASAGAASDSPAAVVTSARFVLQLGVLVLAAKIVGMLFERQRMPVVLGELLAGVLVGPHLLGGIALPFFPKGLMFDIAAALTPSGAVYSVVTVTWVVLFFLIGLDTDLRQIRRYSVGGIAAGLVGFAASFLLILAVLVYAGGPLTGCLLTWTSPAALLFSTMISVTSVGVVARVLAARQRLESPAGVVALTAAMTDNVVGLLAFTVFFGVAQAVAQGAESSAALIASTALRTVVGLGVVALIGFPIAHRMNAMALREKRFTGAFAVSAACLLMAGGAMGVLGLPEVAGAYAMGIAFSSTDLRHEIRERLDFVSVVLVPACFAALGMRIDPNLLANAGVMSAALLFAAVALMAKVAGCAVPAALAGLNPVGCLRVGVASVPRGELSLAMLAVAMGMAVLQEGLFFDLILAVALLCGGATFLISRAFASSSGDVNGRFAGADPVRIAFQFPSPQAAMLMVNRAVEIFEDEGFYAHLLNRHQVLYRISREAQVITLRRTEGEVVFECSERERSLVNGVMLELSSGMEQSLRELQRPLDAVALRKNVQQANAMPSTGVLRNRFLPETLRPRLLATTKQGVIAELVGLLYENGLILDRERAVRAVFEREQSLSTGMEFGVAIPHARTDAVQQLVCAVGLKKEGIDFDSLDRQPVRIVVLVLAPESAPSPQLQFIAQMCRLLNEAGRASLLACQTSEDMYGVLTGGGATKSASVAENQSPVSACLQWQSIALDMASCERDQMVSLLLALCARSGAVGSMDGVRRDIQALPPLVPEKLASGVVFVSVQTQHVYRMVAALGVRAQAVADADGCGRVWIMVLYPASAAGEVVRVKAALAKTLDGAGLASLLFSKTSKDALELLSK